MAIAILLSNPLLHGEQPGQSENLFQKFDSSTFEKHRPAQQPIEPARLDTNLLSAAVFHETNARRKKAGLPLLQHDPGARRAAAIQSAIMAQTGVVTHENRDHPELETLQDRSRKAGLNPRFIAENVAAAFALQYQGGKPFYQRTERGKTIVSYTPEGKPIPPHTYLTFAKALLDDWMSSPGHRKNILHPAPKFLGASCVPARERDAAIPKFYCTQVFYTPL